MTLAVHELPELPKLVADELARGQADPHWRRWLAPELAYGRHNGPAPNTARQAAVAILFYKQNAVWHLPLTVRPASLRAHGGQVSFPGGAIEPKETSREAAHRELVEELFADKQTSEVQIEWLGKLAPLYVFVSDILVTPWIGVLHDSPAWKPQPAEVEQLLPLSVERLLADEEPGRMTIHRGDLKFSAPRLLVAGYEVWGSTAVLLGELRGWLQRLATREQTT